MNIVRNLSKKSSSCLDHLRGGQFVSLPSRFGIATTIRENSSNAAGPKLQVHEPVESKEKTALNETLRKINSKLAANAEGRLFAIIHVCGKQFRVTPEDLIAIEGHWAPDAGERIRLEKVLLLGSRDFTVVGKPLLPQELVSVEATVVEKSLSHTRIHFKKIPRGNYNRTHLHREPLTILRINYIKINEQLVSSKASE
ncbi:Hypothetical predicted protein [Cloeon dipterum]|uniref:Large ribosomal subunit protein bL21m n=1 Tax=Cloeon dipterum TaxID=197152 RepID=A0A8S1DZM5_9INSE|nr:Hypothetical predicted protein [Cloeon dipterum]